MNKGATPKLLYDRWLFANCAIILVNSNFLMFYYQKQFPIRTQRHFFVSKFVVRDISPLGTLIGALSGESWSNYFFIFYVFWAILHEIGMAVRAPKGNPGSAIDSGSFKKLLIQNQILKLLLLLWTLTLSQIYEVTNFFVNYLYFTLVTQHKSIQGISALENNNIVSTVQKLNVRQS